MSKTKPAPDHEYIIVTDKTSKILKATSNYGEAVRVANFLRKAGGEVTIFRATRG